MKMRGPRFIFLGLIILYIIARMLVISSTRDDIFDYNEFFSGTVAMELIQGPALSLKYYMPDDHNFGEIVNGILIAPFYLLFGSSSASSKMVSILFSLGTLVFWYFLLKRFFNQRVAIITSLFFILSPTIYTKNSILSVGSHPESNLFTAIIIFIFYLIFFDNRKDKKYFVLLGLIAGFALFYSYICAITLLVVLLFWFAFERRFMLRSTFYLFLIFFLIGFSPRLYFGRTLEFTYALIVGFIKSAFNWQQISTGSIIFKTINFLSKDLPRLFEFEHSPNVAKYVYWAFFLVSFLSLLWFNRNSIYGLFSPRFKKGIVSKELLLLVFFLIFSLVYILSTYTVWMGWAAAGYIIPLYPFIFAITAIYFDWAIRRNKLFKWISLIVLGIVLSAGLWENFKLVSFSKIGRGFIWKGYSYRAFGSMVGSQYHENDRVLQIIRNVRFPKKRYFLEGLGWGVARYDNPERVATILQENIIKRFSLSEQDRLYYYKGIGGGLARRINIYLHHQKELKLPYDLELDLGILKGIIGRKETEIKRYFWEGLGQEVNLFSDTYYLINKDYLEEQFKPYFYKGIGERTAWHNLDNSPNFLFNFIDTRYRKYAYWGYRGVRSEMLLTKMQRD